ncbi:hypothetical protein ENBRE01_1985 [Enteropsectra breve]|nr:hypothetical protein ENBRE01_1985 [Enteropsectra breve]
MMQNEIEAHREVYIKNIQKGKTWKTHCGPLFKKDAIVLLYKDFDVNTKTRQNYFDCASDGVKYQILDLDDNDITKIMNIETGEILENIHASRLRVFKNKISS